MLSTHFRAPHRPSERELRLTDLYAVQAAELIERRRNEAALLRYREERQALTARLIEVQETESKHLSRELHDVFSQKLAVLGIEMAALAHAPPESSGALSARLLDLTGQLGTLAKDIHRIARQLHPAILDDLGLVSALENECAAFSEQYGIPAEFSADDIPRNLPEDVSLCLYRVAQESLRNAGKHSRAGEVRVTVTTASGEIVLEIQDLGDGFDIENIQGKGGLGLVSMEERARLVSGTLRIRSQRGKGTWVQVRTPWKENGSGNSRA
jgi:signal transduction histidine kinase